MNLELSSNADAVELLWTLVALYGVAVLMPSFIRWSATVRRMYRDHINGERRLRAKSLRRKSAFYLTIVGLCAVLGLWSLVTPPPLRPALTAFDLGAKVVLIVVLALVVIDARWEEVDLRKLISMRRVQRRRWDDPPTEEIDDLDEDGYEED